MRLSFELGQSGTGEREGGEQSPFFMVILADDLVVVQVEAVAHAEPGMGKLKFNIYLFTAQGYSEDQNQNMLSKYS